MVVPEWPRHARLTMECSDAFECTLVPMPPHGAEGRFATLRAAALAACFPGEPLEPAAMVLRVTDAGSGFYADLEDDDAVDLAVDVWRQGASARGPRGGRRRRLDDFLNLRVSRRKMGHKPPQSAADIACCSCSGAATAAAAARRRADPPPRLAVGSLVVLARGFCAVGDAALGCLRPEAGCAQGRVVKISEPGRVRLGHKNGRWDRITGYSVARLPEAEGQGACGAPYWYAREALCLPGAPEEAPYDLPLGATVVLARGHVWLPCAAFGPLRPGALGTIVERVSTEKKPYRVQAPDGRSGWYTRHAVCLQGAPEAAPSAAGSESASPSSGSPMEAAPAAGAFGQPSPSPRPSSERKRPTPLRIPAPALVGAVTHILIGASS